ncbi:zinc chelation protein SecC [Marinomonas piezotolerans]|uniref:Zinc chelation protein SecC n=2 Tax=Marinomonas piezotolerans TaxID=2213058 RepID=A0A370UES2_9GAMM|nr:zinc chelation protein SecC [Marinomonas piezotolerans]
MYHNNPGTAPTAEALMRSRYTAFALNKFDYIAETQKLQSDPKQSADAIEDSNGATQWVRLTIEDVQEGSEKDNSGMVAFSAHFKEGKNTGRLSERSLFEKHDGSWYYIAGEHEVQGNTPHVIPKENKIGRNDPCYCGSGKKFKKCCG